MDGPIILLKEASTIELKEPARSLNEGSTIEMSDPVRFIDEERNNNYNVPIGALKGIVWYQGRTSTSDEPNLKTITSCLGYH